MKRSYELVVGCKHTQQRAKLAQEKKTARDQRRARNIPTLVRHTRGMYTSEGSSAHHRSYPSLPAYTTADASLPSAGATRQSQPSTRQRLCRVPHSAKVSRQRFYRQKFLCRVQKIDTRQSLCRVPSPHSAKK